MNPPISGQYMSAEYVTGAAHARPRRSDHDRTGAGAHVRRPFRRLSVERYLLVGRGERPRNLERPLLAEHKTQLAGWA